jgi:hypothetical protein
MTDETLYPTVDAVQRWINNPAPVHDLHGDGAVWCVETDKAESVTVTVNPVTYHYSLSSCLVDDRDGGLRPVTEVDGVSLDPLTAWEDAHHKIAREDYLKAAGLLTVDSATRSFEATWVLDRIEIETPER